MDKFDLSGVDNNKGYPFTLDDIRYILGLGATTNSSGIYPTINAILSTLGTTYIVSGCVAEPTNNTVSPGWVVIDGKLLYFNGGASVDINNGGTMSDVSLFPATSKTNNIPGTSNTKQYKDSTSVTNIFETNRAILGTSTYGPYHSLLTGQIQLRKTDTSVVLNPSIKLDTYQNVLRINGNTDIIGPTININGDTSIGRFLFDGYSYYGDTINIKGNANSHINLWKYPYTNGTNGTSISPGSINTSNITTNSIDSYSRVFTPILTNSSTLNIYTTTSGDINIGTRYPGSAGNVLLGKTYLANESTVFIDFGGADFRITKSGGGGALSASDIKFKKDINNINYGINTINKLKPVSYNWNDEYKDMIIKKSGIHLHDNATDEYLENYNERINTMKDSCNNIELGFIAQDIQEIIPEIVKYDEQYDYLGIDYPKLTIILTKAIQEQQVMIEDLQKRLSDLDK